VGLIADLCCQTVSARLERSDGRPAPEPPSGHAGVAQDLLAGQLQAITHRGGPLLVLGAAGTGKTRVLEARFCWLV